MDFHFHSDAASLGVVAVAQRFLDSLHARARRAEHYGVAAQPALLREEEVGVYALTAVDHQFDQIGVNLVRAVFGTWLHSVAEREFARLGYGILPEFVEVGGFDGHRLDFLGAETYFDVVPVLPVAVASKEPYVPEARRLFARYFKNAASVL